MVSMLFRLSRYTICACNTLSISGPTSCSLSYISWKRRPPLLVCLFLKWNWLQFRPRIILKLLWYSPLFRYISDRGNKIIQMNSLQKKVVSIWIASLISDFQPECFFLYWRKPFRIFQENRPCPRRVICFEDLSWPHEIYQGRIVSNFPKSFTRI